MLSPSSEAPQSPARGSRWRSRASSCTVEVHEVDERARLAYIASTWVGADSFAEWISFEELSARYQLVTQEEALPC